MIQAQVLDRVKQRTSGKWGATENRKLVVFIDDLQLAAEDSFKARPVHEALREALQTKSW